ncbi:MAG: hypothetical protein JEZ11_18725 [Desulfobacterales bacterium]|nr:hypothetical protein [Desulfobacterales bacterium]
MEQILLESLENESLAPALTDDIAEASAHTVIGPVAEITVFPRSITAANRCLYFLGRRGHEKVVGMISKTSQRVNVLGTPRSIRLKDADFHLALAKADTHAADVIQGALSFLQPRVIGPVPSAGCGDRLGLATPGHVRALAKTHLAAVLCQQSVRENSRTGRSPRQVLDDAMWGAWQEGWRQGFGADADHLKTTGEIDTFVDAGYTFFTIDPGEYMDPAADGADAGQLEEKVAALPWNRLQTTAGDLVDALTRRPLELDGLSVQFTREEVLRSAAKYGAVIAHTLAMVRHLRRKMGSKPFDLEVSVDETDSATTLAEHVYIASELVRLGVVVNSLAPRYVGDFEKGVDYIGDVASFSASFARHAAVARAFGNYKMSLHSGSDKFAIYPAFARHTKGLLHVKTAGTSYLEALRTVAEQNPSMFWDILEFSISRYADDRATYHVSAEIEKLPPASMLPDASLAGVLDDFHAREILHVTYGSVLNHPTLRQGLFDVLHCSENAYTDNLERHFDRHFALLEGKASE